MGQKVLLRLVFGLVLSCVSVKNQVVVTWNGTTVTGPVLIYHDELTVNTGPYQASYDSTQLTPSEQGALVCRSEQQATVHWRTVRNTLIAINSQGVSANFRQLRTKVGVVPSLSRLIASQENLDRNDINVNGLWPCRLNGSLEGSVFVGLYRRGGGGHGPVLCSNNVSVESFKPQNFTLIGDTSGGPPTTYTWTRDGVPITNGGSVNISIYVNSYPQYNLSPRDDSTYQSKLTMTSILPGVYRYSVSNRATPTMVTSSNVTITQGTLTAVQNGLESIRISFFPYCHITFDCKIKIVPRNFRHNIRKLPYTLSVTPGTYTIHVTSNSALTFGESNVTVLDLLAPANVKISYLTATSVNISWTQPENSLPADEYRVNLTLQDNSRTCITTSTLFIISLLESFTYSITITAIHKEFGASNGTTINITLPEATADAVRDISIAVVVTFLLVTIPYTVIIILLVCCICHMKKAIKKVAAEIDLHECAAYGLMSSQQMSLESESSSAQGVYARLN